MKYRLKYQFIYLVGFFLLFAKVLDPSDLGFRSALIDLKLSQKYPPSVALKVIDSAHPKEMAYLLPSPSVIQLMAGFPDLELISLDEFNISYKSESPPSNPLSRSKENSTELETSTTLDRFKHSERFTSKRRQTLPNDYFTEEEKLRLKMANISPDLDSDGGSLSSKVGPDPTLKDRFNEIVSKPEFNKNPGNRANLSESKGITIHGDIEFSREASPPLALTDQHYIDVRRIEEGIPKEVALVNLVNGTFTMNLQSTKGILVGRLTNKKGEIDGEGIVSVIDFVNSDKPKLILQKNQGRFPKAKSSYGKSGWKQNSDSSVSFDTKTKPDSGEVLTSMVNLVGDLVDENKSNDSTDKLTMDSSQYDGSSDFILEASAEYHRPTVTISSAITDSEILLLPDRMIRGLSEILLEQDIPLNLNRGDSLIWGIVKEKGRPLEGVTIRPLLSDARTSYYGGFNLPDRTRDATSDNGVYSVSLSNPGWNELAVDLNDGRRYFANALVYPGKVSHVEIDIPDSNILTTLRSFDAFTGEPVSATLEFQQLDLPIEIGGEGFLNLDIPKTKNLSFVKVTPESRYEKMRLSYTKIQDYLHFPLIPRNWKDSLRSNHKVSDELHTGDIVGFVQGNNFTVELQNKESLSKLIYFDQQGQPIQYGVEGGGFVLFNLEEDQVNLSIVSERNGKKIVRIIRPDKEWTQVINANF